MMKTYYSLFVSLFFAIYNLNAQCSDPTPEVFGDFFVCSGQAQPYAVDTIDADHSYEWTLSGGGELTANGGEATVVWGTIPGTYLLTLVETDDICSGVFQANIVIEGDIVLVCNDNLNISLASDCEITITPDIVLESPDYEDDSYSISITDQNGNPVPTTIDHNYVGQTLEVTITHLCSGNSCWGDITIEDKLAPVVECESGILTCDEYQDFVPAAEISVDNCGDAVLEYTLTEQVLMCDPEFSRIITVVFTATDESGNSSSCTSTYSVEKEFIEDIDLPLSYDGLPGNNPPLSCSGSYPLNSEGNPDPSFTGFPGGLENCSSIEFTYTDINLPLCDASCGVNNLSYKVIREWIIVDWCTGEIEEYQQIIKVHDNEAPIIEAIDDITASANSFDCSAQVILPIAEAMDNCSAEISYVYETNVGIIVNGVLYVDSPAKTMDEGIEITVYASDCCGNVAESTFLVTIVDTTPPVVVADSYETISLLPIGQATMFATSLNDGSYDNCGPIAVTVKRMDNGVDRPSIDLFPPAGNDNAQFNEVVHFFCDDIPVNPIMVLLQVCDDANMDGFIGNFGDNCNTAMVEVEVQDKYAPVIQCPPNMTINCTEFSDIDINDEEQLNALFGSAQAAATCNVELTQTVTGSDDLNCGVGIIIRNFTATNAAGTQSCSQTIAVQPLDENLLTCDRISFDGLDNNIYNWCEVNDNDNDDDDDLPAIEVDGCEGITVAEVNIDQSGLCTTVGVQTTIDTFNYAGSSACKKYLVHYEVIDQCIFDENFVNPNTGQIDPYNSLNGYYEFYLEYDVVDTEAPELICENQFVESDDNCDGFQGTISISATDACTPDNQLIYEWKLDVGANGSIDLPLNGGWFNGNAVNGAAIGLSAIPVGTHIVLWRVDDGCGNMETCSQTITVNPETKEPTPYCFADLSTAVMPTTGSIAIWANDFDAGSFDNCGGPLILSMIPVGDVEGLSDGEAYDESFNHPNVTQQANGDYGFQFDCSYITNGVSAVVEIRVYVTDEQGNYDYCTTALRIDDNFDACEDEMGTMTVSGTVSTEKGSPIELVDVELGADFLEFPKSTVSLEDGTFAFNNLFENVDYMITPARNDNHLNGVSTLDIVLIQKHILGTEVLQSPYAKIAADVNNDCTVTGLDIVQVRKLILGKYSTNEYPNNSSWRFVDTDFEFLTFDQPCIFDEIAELENLTSNEEANFKGVKVGDINESAKANFVEDATVRNIAQFELVIQDDELSQGQELLVPIKASRSELLTGFQFTLKASNATIVDLQSGLLDFTDENFFPYDSKRGIYTVSFHDAMGIEILENDILFSIKIKVDKDTDLSEAISIVEGFTAAEAYVGTDLQLEEPVIGFRNKDNQVVETSNFKLYQNEPNPFNDITNIGFILPRTAEATLSIFDVTGKVLYKMTNTYPAGEHKLSILKSDLSSSGMLYYTLESTGYTATKKMILLD